MITGQSHSMDKEIKYTTPRLQALGSIQNFVLAGGEVNIGDGIDEDFRAS